MIKLTLTDQQCDDIAEALDNPEVGDRHKKKLLVITMHQQGAQHGFIADCLRISPTTLIGYLREYQEGGLPAVLEDRYYRPSSALEPFWQCLIWVRVPHLASFLLGHCLRRLRRDWMAHYATPIVLAETFVERERFAGTCYRAANWRRLGEMVLPQKSGRLERSGFVG